MHWHRKEHPSYPKSWQGGWPFPVDYPLEPAPLLAVLSAVCLSLSVTISIYFHCLNSITLFHIKILFSILEKSKWLSINYIIFSLYFSIPFLNSISKFYSRFWKRELSSTIRYFVQRFSPIFLTYPFSIRL